MMQLSQVCEQVNGTLNGADVLLQNVSINSREDCENRLFVALKGDNFDAHEFIDQAADAGAGAVMVERAVETSLPTITVASTHQALKDLAAWWRQQFALPVIGVTGSVGKTSVKEMLGAIFQSLGPGVITKGNLNNEIGVPLTLMRLTPTDRYAIVEMGMNRAGEIARLTDIVRPTIALVTNAAAAHLEGLGSVAAVAEAKGEIFEGLANDGIAVINADDRFVNQWRTLARPRPVISFGLGDGADVTASYRQEAEQLNLSVDAFGEKFPVILNAVGEHNVRNALAAIAVAFAARVPIDHIQNGLAAYRQAAGRLEINRVGGITLIDDTYNANPASMEAAINVLAEHLHSTLIVGDMAELGEAAAAEHRAIGQLAARRGIETVYACGDYAQHVVEGFDETVGGIKARGFELQPTLIDYLKSNMPGGTTLVKGSRSAHMERVIAALISELKDKPLPSPTSHQGEA